MQRQPVYDIAEICNKQNVKQVVLCPGSRCAPLTLAFSRHPQINTRTFSDERSAGFVALGMAQASGQPVVVVCTSGTAVYNLAPAVAEAYFSHTPLIVLSADRPSEWIAQHDGQTIHQAGIFGPHVKKNYQLPQEYDHPDSAWVINRMVNEAINESRQYPAGPVHINAPFREPLYPSPETPVTFSSDVRVMIDHRSVPALDASTKDVIAKAWPEFHNILIVVGQHHPDTDFADGLTRLQRNHNIPIVHDVVSNLHTLETSIRHSDLFLGEAPDHLRARLQPDLLITFGDALVSKNLKLFLRKYPAKRHWHIQPSGSVADTFKTLTDIFHATPASFVNLLNTQERPQRFEAQKQENYFKLWEVEERRVTRVLDAFFSEAQLSELALVKTLLDGLPPESNLHLANSMSVRYANFISLQAGKSDIRVYANRGTSGIDGSTSTAVGHALVSGRMNFLVTGDLAFFYDRNAFWHNYPLEKLRVLLLNNHGGLIFDVLEGPSSMPEAQELFITRQVLNARHLCEEFGLDYLKVDNLRKVKNLFKDFFSDDKRTKIIEFESDTTTSKEQLQTLKLKIKNSYES